MLEEKIRKYLIKKYGEKSIHPKGKPNTIKNGFNYVVEILANYNLMSGQKFTPIYKKVGEEYGLDFRSIRTSIHVYCKNLTSLSCDGFLMYSYMELLQRGIIKG